MSVIGRSPDIVARIFDLSLTEGGRLRNLQYEAETTDPRPYLEQFDYSISEGFLSGNYVARSPSSDLPDLRLSVGTEGLWTWRPEGQWLYGPWQDFLAGRAPRDTLDLVRRLEPDIDDPVGRLLDTPGVPQTLPLTTTWDLDPHRAARDMLLDAGIQSGAVDGLESDGILRYTLGDSFRLVGLDSDGIARNVLHFDFDESGQAVWRRGLRWDNDMRFAPVLPGNNRDVRIIADPLEALRAFSESGNPTVIVGEFTDGTYLENEFLLDLLRNADSVQIPAFTPSINLNFSTYERLREFIGADNIITRP